MILAVAIISIIVVTAKTNSA